VGKLLWLGEKLQGMGAIAPKGSVLKSADFKTKTGVV